MSDVLKAVLLGIVQGLTEFLPISSTGHLVLAEEFLGLDEDAFGLRFDAAIHLGTLVAVLIYFRATLAVIVVDVLRSIAARNVGLTPNSRMGWLLLLGTIPAGIAGLLLEGFIEDTFRSPAIVATMLIVFTLPIWLADRFASTTSTLDQVSAPDAVVVGVAQSIALLPGVSRSGITIAAGMARGLSRPDAATFAFLLATPVVLAAGGKQVFDILTGEGGESGLENELAVYGAGLITAAIVGYIAIAFLLRYLRANSLGVFIAYRLVLGALVLALVAAGVV